MACAYQNIVFSLEDRIARLTLNRPDKLNSFNEAMHLEVREALIRTREGHARVLLLTGAGRGFCAGQDLGDRAMAGGGEEAAPDLGASIEQFYAPLVRSLHALAMPVVGAVNGVAAGAGANLALACDLVVATQSAYFYEPFCKLGLVPDTGGTYFLPRLVGTARALGLTMLGERLTADQAAAWGLIWRSVPDDGFAAAVEALVGQLAQAPTRGLAAIKAALYASACNSLDTQLDMERDLNRSLGQSQDYAEGVSAFLEKRAARFSGQ
ncbi:MAG: 2-(1,2-epoxy-1,2-dihydrophenyl)acetyl-CoA isomerase PaaG [Terriglobales bacterium]